MKIKLIESAFGACIQTVSSSSAHGLPKIVKSQRKPTKIMWAIFFIISSGFCAYSVIKSLTNYLEFSVVSLERVIYEPNLEFPGIMFCNKNSLKSNALNETIKEILDKGFADHLKYLNISNIHLKLEFEKKKIHSYIFKTSSNYSSFFKNIKDILISCRHG
jgi:hypothetical protein